VNNGRHNNENFVSIPHARFIDMLTSKAALAGIQVEASEESYTAKASFLDLDLIPNYKPNDEQEYVFSGKRIGRRNRLYGTANGYKICADINRAYNIRCKRRLNAFARSSGLCGSPCTVSSSHINQRRGRQDASTNSAHNLGQPST
jgi:putative transposase